MKLVGLFIIVAMLVACAPKVTSTGTNSATSAKESGVQNKVERDSTSALQVRSENDLMVVFSENTSKRLKVVYNNYLKKRRGFEGDIEAKIVVLSNGDVEKVEILSATTDYPEFEKAISDDLLQWKYASGDYHKCTFRIPLKFRDENDNAQVKNEGGLTISKGRSAKKIKEIFNQNVQTRTVKIYNDYLRKRPRFKGKIVARITVIPSGDVEKVEIVSATTDYPEFEKAISDDLLQWKYDSGDYVDCTFTIPLTFSED